MGVSPCELTEFKVLAEQCGLAPDDICFYYDDPTQREQLRNNPEFRRAARAYGLFLAQEAEIPTPDALAFLSDGLFRYYEEHGLDEEGASDAEFDQFLLALGAWHLELAGGRTTVRRAFVFPGQRAEIGSSVALGCTTPEEVRNGILGVLKEGKKIRDILLNGDGKATQTITECMLGSSNTRTLNNLPMKK